MIDGVDFMFLDDILEPVGLGHVERYEWASRGVVRKGLDVGGDDILPSVFFDKGLEEFRADLT